ncbi:MAG TPA: MFS transporter [Planktothrix sp.]|jgi:ACS family tartrate transporter-like MFS transporter
MQTESAIITVEQVLKKVAWRLLPFMFVLYIVSYLDRINISYAGLQMNTDLGFDEVIFGRGAGIFFLGYFLFGIPSNLIMQKLGARKWISGIMVVWGVLSVSLAFVKSPEAFYRMRFLLGVAEAGFFPGMILYLTYWFPRREHGMAVARFMTAIPAAGILGGLIASAVLSMQGLYGLASWKWLFIITGTPAIFLGVLVFLFLVNGPEDAPWLNEREKELLIERLHQDRPSDSTARQKGALLPALLNVRVWVLGGLYFLMSFAMYGFQLWLPQIIKAITGGDNGPTALISAIPPIFQALGMVLVARHSDNTGERRKHLALSAAIAAAGLAAAAALLQQPVMAVAALCVAAFGIWGTVGPFWAIPTGYLSPVVAVVGIGLINSCGALGGFAGPDIVGEVTHLTHNFTSSLLVMAGSLVCAGIVVMVLRFHPSASSESHSGH